MIEIVFATNNLNKLEEIGALLGQEFCLLGLKDLEINEDIPEDFGGSANAHSGAGEWTEALSRWAAQRLAEKGDMPLLALAQPEFERTLIKSVLQTARGRKQEAAKLLGWGRNTLTRKIKELGLDG